MIVVVKAFAQTAGISVRQTAKLGNNLGRRAVGKILSPTWTNYMRRESVVTKGAQDEHYMHKASLLEGQKENKMLNSPSSVLRLCKNRKLHVVFSTSFIFRKTGAFFL